MSMIQNLDDNSASHILAAIVRSRAAAAPAWGPRLTQALAQEFQVTAEADSVSDGDLARQALLVLAEDPETRRAIDAMAVNQARSPQKFDFGATLAMTTLVLVVLQTHVEFDCDSTEKWSLKIKKKSASDALLKTLVQKLISFTK